jgi:hypothetical protein
MFVTLDTEGSLEDAKRACSPDKVMEEDSPFTFMSGLPSELLVMGILSGDIKASTF